MQFTGHGLTRGKFLYVRMKNKIIKMQHVSLNMLTKEWFDDSLWNIKQGSLKRTKLNFRVTVLSENKQSWLTSF